MFVKFEAYADQNGEWVVATRGETRARLFVSTSLSSSPIFGTAAKAIHANTILLTRHLASRAENLSDTGFDKEAPDIVRNSLSRDIGKLRKVAIDRRNELDNWWNDLATPRFPVPPVTSNDQTSLAASIASAIAAAHRREAICQRLAEMKMTDAFATAIGNVDIEAALIEAGPQASPFPADLYQRLVSDFAEQQLAERFVTQHTSDYRLGPSIDDPLCNGIDGNAALEKARVAMKNHEANLAEIEHVAVTMKSTVDFAAAILNIRRDQAFGLLNADN